MADERFTYFSVDIDLRQPDIQQDTNATSTDCLLVAKTYNNSNYKFNQEASLYDFTDYMTTELNHNVLDGSLAVATFNPTTARSSDIPFISVKSGGTGTEDDRNWSDEDNSSLVLNFTNSINLPGFTLYFKGDYPKEVKIVCQSLDDENEVIEEFEDIVTINSNIQNCSVYHYNVRRIIITPVTSYVPDRAMKLYYVSIGLYINYGENEVKSAKVVQETNLLGDKVSINTFDFDIIDTTNDFNYGNTANIIGFFKRLSPVVPKVELNNEVIELGNYYIDTVNSDLNLGKIHSFSILGVLDNISFNEGAIYSNTPAGDIISKIFQVAGITNYYVDSTISSTPITGTLPPCTCRQALQNIVFITRAIIITNSTDYDIQLIKVDTSRGLNISRNDKISTKVEDAEYVTGVEVSYSTYTLDSSLSTIVEETTYLAGTHLILFSEPYDPSTLTVEYNIISPQVTINKRSTYYIQFTTPSNASVILAIKGKRYNSSTKTITLNRGVIEDGKPVNIKKFNVKLCNYIQAYNLATDLINYYQTNSLEISIKQFSRDISMLKKQIVFNEIQGLDNYVGIYVSRVFDLTGGFIDDAKLMGYYQSAQAIPHYATPQSAMSDIYSGDYLV